MNDKDMSDLIAAWALDAVDDEERALVEEVLDRDPALRDEAWRHIETASYLADDARLQPPASLKKSVFAAIGDEHGSTLAQVRQGTPGQPGDELAKRRSAAADGGGLRPRGRERRRPGRTVRIILAAAAAVAVAIPTGLAIQESQRAQQAEQSLSALAQVLADPDARIVSADITGGGSAQAIVAGDSMVFTASGLSELAGDRTYQLWTIDDAGPVSEGLLDVRDGGTVVEISASAGEVSGVAVSVEPDGGSEAPTTDPIVTLGL